MPLSKEGRALLAEKGYSPDIVEQVLSHDAQLVGAAWFGLMRPERGELKFHMREYKPTARAQAALDELVEAGLIRREKFNNHGVIRYVPQWNFHSLFTKFVIGRLAGDRADDFPLTEPIT